MGAIYAGATITQNRKYDTSRQCIYCNAKNVETDETHKFWHCTRFTHIRQKYNVPPTLHGSIPYVTKCTGLWDNSIHKVLNIYAERVWHMMINITIVAAQTVDIKEATSRKRELIQHNFTSSIPSNNKKQRINQEPHDQHTSAQNHKKRKHSRTNETKPATRRKLTQTNRNQDNNEKHNLTTVYNNSIP